MIHELYVLASPHQVTRILLPPSLLAWVIEEQRSALAKKMWWLWGCLAPALTQHCHVACLLTVPSSSWCIQPAAKQWMVWRMASTLVFARLPAGRIGVATCLAVLWFRQIVQLVKSANRITEWGQPFLPLDSLRQEFVEPRHDKVKSDAQLSEMMIVHILY